MSDIGLVSKQDRKPRKVRTKNRASGTPESILVQDNIKKIGPANRFDVSSVILLYWVPEMTEIHVTHHQTRRFGFSTRNRFYGCYIMRRHLSTPILIPQNLQEKLPRRRGRQKGGGVSILSEMLSDRCTSHEFDKLEMFI